MLIPKESFTVHLPNLIEFRHKDSAEYDRMVKELNVLDRFAVYKRGGPDVHLKVTYQSHFYEMTKPEARRHLNFLRKIRGIGEEEHHEIFWPLI